MSAPSPLWELFLMRVRTLIREPSALFWVFAFPLLTSLALGIAFRNRELSRLQVSVADGPDADAVARQLDAVPGLAAERRPLGEAREELRRGRVALVLVPGPTPELVVDPTQPDGRTAKLITVDALERMHGRADTLHPVEHESTAPGSRYIDFLIPGLLGFGLMSSGLWGVGWALVQMRSGRLLKRFVATPMRRSDFLLSFVLSRALWAVAEIAFYVGFARLLFGVRVFGSVVGLGLFALAGALCFAGLSLAVSCRAQNSETASGLMNLVSMPMVVLSGVFFSASHFPAWTQPAIKLLPLTALNDGLRAIMIDGASIAALGSQALVLLVWGLASFGFALRFFRWA
jgi:ABC-type multidrug transport system permease subunit